MPVAVFEVNASVPDDLARSHTVGPLDAGRIVQLIRLLTGETAPARVVEALHQRTKGDPRQVLIRLLVALHEGEQVMDVLASTPSGPGPAVFRREGEYWTLAYAGQTVRLRDAKGLHYLAPLLREPGRSFHVRDLVSAGGGGMRRADAERARQTVTKGIGLLLERLQRCHPTLAEHLKTTVKRGYTCRYLSDPRQGIAWET